MGILSLFSPEVLILLQALFVGGMILFLVISRDYTKGIYLWLLSLLFFKYQKLNMTGSMLPDISLDRVLFLFLIVIFIIEVLSRKREIFSLTGIEYSMFLFCAFAIISMMWSGLIIKEGGRLNIGELLSGYVLPFFLFFISQHVYDTRERREGFIKLAILIGLYLSFTAIFEHFGAHRLIWPKYILDSSFGIHSERARGPFTQAAVNGTALGFALSASFYFLLNSGRRDLWRFFSLGLLVISPVAIFFTYTRAAWMGAFLGLAVIAMFILKQRKKAFIVVFVVLCIIVILSMNFFLDESSVSFALERFGSKGPIYDRLNLYIASLNMFLHHPLFGVGFGKFSDYVSEYFKNVNNMYFYSEETSGHDSFAGILAEMGLLGIILIAFIYFWIVSRSIRLYRYFAALHDGAGKAMVTVFWGFLAVYVINSIFIEMRYFEFINAFFFIFAGIICGWERAYEKGVA